MYHVQYMKPFLSFRNLKLPILGMKFPFFTHRTSSCKFKRPQGYNVRSIVSLYSSPHRHNCYIHYHLVIIIVLDLHNLLSFLSSFNMKNLVYNNDNSCFSLWTPPKKTFSFSIFISKYVIINFIVTIFLLKCRACEVAVN